MVIGPRPAGWIVLAAAALAAPAAFAADDVLAPGPQVAMLRTVAGVPILLRAPVAVAPAAGDLFILDAGAGAVVRADPFSGLASVVLQRAFSPGARLVASADQSLLLLEPAANRIERLDRGGRTIAVFAADASIGRLADVALDDARGRVLAADGLHAQLVAYPPLGRQPLILPLRGDARQVAVVPAAIAAGAHALYASDPRCGCVATLSPEGVVTATRGHGELAQPGRLAVDPWERVFVLDRGDRALKMLDGARVAERWPLAALGVVEPADVAIASGWLYLADPLGGRVRMMRVLPPKRGNAGGPGAPRE